MVTTTRIALIFIMIGFSGCSGQKEEDNIASPAVLARKKPMVSLAVQSPTDPEDIKAGVPLDVVCMVTAEPGGFDPSIVIFQISDSKNKNKNKNKKRSKSKSKAEPGSYAVSDRTSSDDGFTFTYHTEAPPSPGRFTIDAKVLGVDPSLPSNGPAPAPAADGTRAKPGARVELHAPRLEVEVKK